MSRPLPVNRDELEATTRTALTLAITAAREGRADTTVLNGLTDMILTAADSYLPPADRIPAGPGLLAMADAIRRRDQRASGYTPDETAARRALLAAENPNRGSRAKHLSARRETAALTSKHEGANVA